MSNSEKTPGRKRDELLGLVLEEQSFDTQHSLAFDLNRRGITTSEVPSLLVDFEAGRLYNPVDRCLRKVLRGPHQLFRLGFFFSQVPLDYMPEEARTLVEPISRVDYEFGIVPGFQNWWLCNDAERYLSLSLSDGMIATVYDSLIIKFDGKFSALCYRSISNGKATFLRGIWYSPVDLGLRASIKAAGDVGDLTCRSPQGSWALMRATKDPSILPEIDQFVASLPPQLPTAINGQSRESYIAERSVS